MFWGDHGWHLGEKEHGESLLCGRKRTRAPFIWVVPESRNGWRLPQPGRLHERLSTLCDWCTPHTGLGRGGKLRPLLADPAAAWTGVGVTTFGQNNHAVRTARWRYIRYADGGEELYDHQNDEYEWTNLAGRRKHAAMKAELAKHLSEEQRAGHRARRQ